MNVMPSFEDIMTKLAPYVQQLEEKQHTLKKEASKISLRWAGVIAILILAACFFIPPLVAIISGVLILLLVVAIIYHYKSLHVKEYYKKDIISRFVGSLMEKGEYLPEGGISEDTFKASDLFISPDRYHSEDLIRGVVDKTSFCFAEVDAEQKIVTSNGKTTTTTWVTIFKGIIFIADFNKDFAGKTLVSRNSFFKLSRGRVKLENVEFERRFDVFSSDQVEARYILSPSMMERIIALDKKLDDEIVISFHNSRMFIAINNSTDYFEIGMSAEENRKTLLREYNLITSMISIIDELDLNTRIWSKA